MAVVMGGEAKGPIPLHRGFKFVIKNAMDMVTGVNSYHYRWWTINSACQNEDCWLLKLRRADPIGQLPSGTFYCKLRLFSSNDNWKIARITVRRSAESEVEFRSVAILFKNGSEFDIGTFHIHNTLEINVEMLECWEAKPKLSIQLAKSTLTTDVLSWFQSEEFGDVTIVAADGIELRCHRDILSARSEVFHSMFNSGMTEARENVVNIDGYEGEIIAALLAFVYTDECGNIGPIAYRLYVAAAHYGLDGLKFLCESALAANLSEVAAVVKKTRKLAELYHLDDLKAKCVDFLDSRKGEKFTFASWTGRTESRIDVSSDTYTTVGLFRLDYNFAFTVNNWARVEFGQVLLSNIFSHRNGDRWQLGLKRIGLDIVRCHLRLLNTTSEVPKFAFITGEIVQVSFSAESTPVALFRHSGDTYDFLALYIESVVGDAKFHVQLVKWKYAETPAEHGVRKSHLATEVLKWIETEDFGDTTVVASDGMKFRCHRDILARRCEVLKLKINSTMKEAGKDVINNESTQSLKSQVPAEVLNIEDFDGKIVAQLILFLYVDQIGEIESIADRLYVAADLYQLDRLKVLCQSALAASLSPDTFVKSYRLANYFHLDQLLAVCGDYLQLNKAELLIDKLFFEAMKIQYGNEGQKEQK